MPTQKQINKKKKRERQVKEKLHKRREARMRTAIEDKKEAARVAELEKERGLGPVKMVPYQKNVAQTPEEITEQIKRNFEVLKALEDEANKEIAGRGNVSEEAVEQLKKIQQRMVLSGTLPKSENKSE